MGTTSKAKKKFDEAGISPEKVPVKTLLPLLDAGSLEEDDQMLDRWANLLAAAANPEANGAFDVGYIEVLRQLSPTQALVLDRLHDYYNEMMARREPSDRSEPLYVVDTAQIEMSAIELMGISGVGTAEFENSMDNLVRLNLVTSSSAVLPNPEIREPYYSDPSTYYQAQFTRFGHAFVSACKGTR